MEPLNEQDVYSNEMTNYNSIDAIQNLLREMTPEMEREITKELTEKYANHFEEELLVLKQRAKKSCEDLVEDRIIGFHSAQLNEYKARRELIDSREVEIQLLKQQLLAELDAQVEAQCDARLEQEKPILLREFRASTNAQQQENSFLAKDIRDRLAFEMKAGNSAEVSRKERLLKLNYKKKFEEEKKHMESEYANQIEIDCQKQMEEIETNRAEIAKQTAANNMKILQCNEEKKMLFVEKDQAEKNYAAEVAALQDNLNALKAELQQLQSHQASRNTLQHDQPDYQEIQNTIHLRQQDESDFDGDQKHHHHHHRNNLFAGATSNVDLIDQIQAMHSNVEQNHQAGDSQKFNGLNTTKLLNQNAFVQQAKSPFLLSLTNKMNLLGSSNGEVDSRGVMDQLKENEKIIPQGLDLLAPPQALFLPSGASFVSREKQQESVIEKQLNKSQEVPISSKYHLLKEYNSVSIADKVLSQIQQAGGLISSPAVQGKIPSASQYFSNIFSRELASQSQQVSQPLQNNGQNNQNNSFEHNTNPTNENYAPQSNQVQESFITAKQQQSSSKINQLNTSLQQNQDAPPFRELSSQNTVALASAQYQNTIVNKKQDTSRYMEALSENERYDLISRRTTTRQSKEKTGKAITKQTGIVTKYQSIFQIKDTDNEKSRKLKQLHTEITETLQREHSLDQKVKAMQEKVFSEFLPYLNCSKETEKDLANACQNVIFCWEKHNAHLESREAFLEDILNGKNQISELKEKLAFEQDYWQNTQQSELEQAIDIQLSQRNLIKSSIDTQNEYAFSYKANKRFYSAIRTTNQAIETLLARYQHQRKQPFIWRGIRADQLLTVDAFEEDLLQKEELREEISKKIIKKL